MTGVLIELKEFEISESGEGSGFLVRDLRLEIFGGLVFSFHRVRWKCTALIMVLAVALFSVLAINSPLADGLVFKDMSFLKEYKQFEMIEPARASFA